MNFWKIDEVFWKMTKSSGKLTKSSGNGRSLREMDEVSGNRDRDRDRETSTRVRRHVNADVSLVNADVSILSVLLKTSNKSGPK